MSTVGEVSDTIRDVEAKGLALMVTAEKAAAMFEMGVSTWWRTVASGGAPAPVKIGGATRWRRDELLAWSEAGCPRREQWVVMYALMKATGQVKPSRKRGEAT